jgi:hypothetical protein
LWHAVRNPVADAIKRLAPCDAWSASKVLEGESVRFRVAFTRAWKARIRVKSSRAEPNATWVDTSLRALGGVGLGGKG